MVDRVHPTQAEASSNMTSGVIKWAASADWVVPSGEDYLASLTDLSGTPLNGFTESHSSSNYDVTIDTGEGFIGGRWCGRDVSTTVTLASGTNNQTVYAGWKSSTANEMIIGLDSAFPSTDNGRRTPIWEFDTDSSGTTVSRRVHDKEPIHSHAKDSDQLNSIDSSNYARTDVKETFTDTVVIEDPTDGNALYVKGANETDSDVVTVDGDADSGQDDDLLKLRSVEDPSSNTPTNSDSVLVTKGDGRVGINTYSPSSEVELIGDMAVTGQIVVDRGGRQIVVKESDTSTDWVMEAQSSRFVISEDGVEEWLEIDTGQSGRVEMPGGSAGPVHRLTPQSSEPSPVQNGSLAVQDGSGWDPAGTGQLELVCYLGSWTQIS